MRILALAVMLAAPALAAADPVQVCAPPHRGPLDNCGKGASLGEDDVARCQADAAARRHQGPARFRIDRGPWIAYDATAWVCVPVPAGAARITVENQGRAIASWRLPAAASCASGVFDIVGPNFYRAMNTRCARRPHAHAITP